MQQEVTFSNIFSSVAGLISDGFRYWLVFVAVVGGMGALGGILGLTRSNPYSFSTGFVVRANDGPGVALFGIAAAVVSVVATYFLTAQLLDMRGLLRDRATRIWAFIGMSILMGLGLVLGIILLIVPGIILMVRWSAATGYLIGGRRGVTESLGASWEATKGHSWPIFFAGLVMVIAYFVAAGSLGATIGLTLGGMGPVVAIVTALVDSFGSVLSVAFGVAVYSLVAHDGEAVSDVFS